MIIHDYPIYEMENKSQPERIEPWKSDERMMEQNGQRMRNHGKHMDHYEQMMHNAEHVMNHYITLWTMMENGCGVRRFNHEKHVFFVNWKFEWEFNHETWMSWLRCSY